MFLSEQVYNPSAHQWVIAQETGWLPYVADSSLTLSSSAGVRYIQAWVADGAGNISTVSTLGRMDYRLAQDVLYGAQIRIYRVALIAGETWQITLNTISGDADLYVWDVDGSPLGYSGAAGTAQDRVNFTARVSGVYQIEVQAMPEYATSTYELLIERTASTSSTAGLLAAKSQRTQPAIVADNTPVTQVSLPSAPIKTSFAIYLPVLNRASK